MSQIRARVYSALTVASQGEQLGNCEIKTSRKFQRNFCLARIFLQIESGSDKLMTNDDTNGVDISEYKCLFGRFLRPRNLLGISRVSKQVSPLTPSVLPPLILESVLGWMSWCQSGLRSRSFIPRNNHWWGRQWVCLVSAECHPDTLTLEIMTPR